MNERADASVTGIVLAAGASQRTGFPKALALLDGVPFVARVAGALAEGGAGRVVVVTGPPHAERVARALERSGARASLAYNAEPGRGMLSSLQVGLAAAFADPRALGFVVALVDQPHLAPGTVGALLGAWRESDADLVRPRYGGRRGHPFVVSRALGAALVGEPPQRTVRELLAGVERALELDVCDAAALEDLDTAADVERAGARRP